MLNIEAPQKTVERFSKNWKRTGNNSLVAELISISKETNREPDTYHFLVKDEKLIDPNTNRNVLDFVAEGVEKKVAENLENWTTNKSEGIALWISPKKDGVYPCPKVIIHKIAYTLNGEKVVLNSVILFDAEIENPEYKRETLYTLPDNDENIFKIISWIKRKTGQEIYTKTTEKTSYKKALYFADLIRIGVPNYEVICQMQKEGFLGENSISCSGGSSFSSIVEKNSSILISTGEDQYGSLDFICPHCGRVNTRPAGRLVPNCAHCSEDVRC